ncbi:hypothetical protein ACFYM7_37610 [Streptomyces cyaneofuscatus]|uniref:hypothetical protein n=1 Tax=Streptomyces cyaneofuscatus TaxID=66883 RepID=UPI0036CCF2A3
MTTHTPDDALTRAARSLAASLADTADHLAAILTCHELTDVVDLLAAAGHHTAGTRWIEWHTGDPQCTGHTAPDTTPATPTPTFSSLYDEHGRYSPAPGTECPYSVADIAYATARALGKDWAAEALHWGTGATLHGPHTSHFTFLIDVEGNLCLTYDQASADAWPDTPDLPRGVHEYNAGIYLPDASSPDDLDDLKHLAEQIAAAVRAITGH